MNIIFDIGNVICDWDPRGLIDEIFESPDEQEEAMEKVIMHSDWRLLDRGVITLEQAFAAAKQRSSLDPGKIEQVMAGVPATLKPNEQVVQAIHDLHARGYPLFVLSNMPEHSWQYLAQHFDFWHLFKSRVLSFEIKLIKPDPAIFDYILSEFDLDPSQTVFLDDIDANTLAASKKGIKTITVTDLEQSIRELYELLGLDECGFAGGNRLNPSN